MTPDERTDPYRRAADAPDPPPLPWMPVIGNVVRLRAGGPSMSVEKVSASGHRVELIWFVDGHVHRDVTDTRNLELVLTDTLLAEMRRLIAMMENPPP